MTTYWHPKTGEPLRRVRVECLFGSSFVFVTEGGERLHALAHADTRRIEKAHLDRTWGGV